MYHLCNTERTTCPFNRLIVTDINAASRARHSMHRCRHYSRVTGTRRQEVSQVKWEGLEENRVVNRKDETWFKNPPTPPDDGSCTGAELLDHAAFCSTSRDILLFLWHLNRNRK